MRKFLKKYQKTYQKTYVETRITDSPVILPQKEIPDNKTNNLLKG